jgi:hypothetical protein
MRNKAGMVDTNTNRQEPISMKVPRHLQNSEPGMEPARLTPVEIIGLDFLRGFSLVVIG